MTDFCFDCGGPLQSHWNFCPICSSLIIFREDHNEMDYEAGPLDFSFIEEGEAFSV